MKLVPDTQQILGMAAGEEASKMCYPTLSLSLRPQTAVGFVEI